MWALRSNVQQGFAYIMAALACFLALIVVYAPALGLSDLGLALLDFPAVCWACNEPAIFFGPRRMVLI